MPHKDLDRRREYQRDAMRRRRETVRRAKAQETAERLSQRPRWPAKDLAWAAGLFEGEGTVTVTNGGRKGYVRSLATVTSTDPDVLEPFRQMWPGQFRRVGPKSPNAREAWVWTVEGETLMAFLLDVRPHLRTERVSRKFDLLVEIQNARQPGSRDPEYHAKMLAYREQMRVLNRRGRHEPPPGNANNDPDMAPVA